MNVPIPIQYDSTTKFFICTDINGVPTAYCEIMGFVLSYIFDPGSDAWILGAGFNRIFEYNSPSFKIIL